MPTITSTYVVNVEMSRTLVAGILNPGESPDPYPVLCPPPDNPLGTPVGVLTRDPDYPEANFETVD
jgi:hypothetical protein